MIMTHTPTLHVRFNGRSEELDFTALNLLPDAGDDALRAALARRYDCDLRMLDDYVVVREQRAVIVRPIAFYG